MTDALYDTIGVDYAKHRRPDPRIAQQIRRAIGTARSVCNIGAGAGSYEPHDVAVTAVEPSQRMINQRKSAVPVVQAFAEQLPFDDLTFDVAMTVLSIHHWNDPGRGLAEMSRVSHRQVIMTFDVSMIDTLWFVRDYLPEVCALENGRAWNVDRIAEVIGATRIEIVPVPHDCTDGFQAAYWRRPEMYLRADVRAAISSFAQLPVSVVERSIQKLKLDIENGTWHERYSHLKALESADFGYRLIIAE